jgi:hypothetical protein
VAFNLISKKKKLCPHWGSNQHTLRREPTALTTTPRGLVIILSFFCNIDWQNLYIIYFLRFLKLYALILSSSLIILYNHLYISIFLFWLMIDCYMREIRQILEYVEMFPTMVQWRGKAMQCRLLLKVCIQLANLDIILATDTNKIRSHYWLDTELCCFGLISINKNIISILSI